MKSDDIIKDAKKQAIAMNSSFDVTNHKNGATVLPTFKNMTIYLSTDQTLVGLFRYNRFSHQTEVAVKPDWGSYGSYPKPINDHDIIHLRKYLAEEYGIDCSMANLDNAITYIATKNSYDPVLRYLKSVKWDGEPRIDNWLTEYMGVEEDTYSRFIGKMTLVGACARVDKPGIKYDYMLILEGQQGIGKSEGLRALGGEWFKEMSLTDRTKDTVEKMQGAWIIEVPELSVFKKRDIESLKAFITMNTDKERLPYGRRSQFFPRRNIFVGTINPSNSGYLTDSTGNRRFMPVSCTEINVPRIFADRDQLWAEAWQAYKDNSPLYPTIEISGLSSFAQAKREIVDEWQDDIERHVKDMERVTSTDIWIGCLSGTLDRFDLNSQRRISDCLQKLGWERRTIRVNGKPIKGFSRSEDDIEKRRLDDKESLDLPWED